MDDVCLCDHKRAQHFGAFLRGPGGFTSPCKLMDCPCPRYRPRSRLTICSLCGKDKQMGRVNKATGDFECGKCIGDHSVAQNPTRGNGRVRP